MIYVVITLFIFLVEMLCWGLRTRKYRRWAWCNSDHTPEDPVCKVLRRFVRTLKCANTGRYTRAGRTVVKRMLEWSERSTWTDHVDVLLRVMEVGNSIW